METGIPTQGTGSAGRTGERKRRTSRGKDTAEAKGERTSPLLNAGGGKAVFVILKEKSQKKKIRVKEKGDKLKKSDLHRNMRSIVDEEKTDPKGWNSSTL